MFRITKKAIVVKIGGNIFEDQDNLNSTISQFRRLLEEKILEKIIIISGGGTLANFVRKLDNKFNLGNDLAHWMAISAMDYNGINILKSHDFIIRCDGINNLKKVINNTFPGSIYVFLPYDFLNHEDALPHSWNVTSDSITLHLVSKLGLEECFLIKDIDGIIINKNDDFQVIKELTTSEYRELKMSNQLDMKKANNKEIKKSKPIDQYLLTLIDTYKIPAIILNGSKSKQNIFNYFAKREDNDNIFTKIL